MPDVTVSYDKRTFCTKNLKNYAFQLFSYVKCFCCCHIGQKDKIHAEMNGGQAFIIYQGPLR